MSDNKRKKILKTSPASTTNRTSGVNINRKKQNSKKQDSAFPIVGIGASAGGLAAFEAFFSGMPPNEEPGMAFVLVQHLAPDHKSILTDLIQRYTRMKVFEVEDGMEVKPNCAYIIPPNHDMAFVNGKLQLLEPSAPRGQRLPIDFFFRSLAEDQHERAICIVLSGTGSDGTLGVRAIKGEGGMAMVQNPASSEYDGMPRSALGTGMVDYELPPAEMPDQLMAYVSQAYGKNNRPAVPAPEAGNMLNKIFALLHSQTGHDFSQYKPSTILRRIERRMAVHQIEDMEKYVKFLQQTSTEVEALFRDLLIGVTSFFRDPEAFEVIENQCLPKLLENIHSETPLRIWVTGCSTGEEAYSLAILVTEYLEKHKKNDRVQIFATDIDSKAIDTARSGIYPASIAADISAERLSRHFIADPGELHGITGSYRVKKNIRDMLIFSEHNVIKDPPFSKMDLISCRNLLIYMSSELQKKVIPLFHYALKTGGYLFLGTSESVGDYSDLFTSTDRKGKIYQANDTFQNKYWSTASQLLLPNVPADESMSLPLAKKTHTKEPHTLQKMAEQELLQHIRLSGILVNAKGDILYLHSRSGRFLEPAPGEFDRNVIKMAREGLKRPLTTALNKAASTKSIDAVQGIKVKMNGDHVNDGHVMVDLTVRPITMKTDFSDDNVLYLIVLEESPVKEEKEVYTPQSILEIDGNTTQSDADLRIASLLKELHDKEEYLKATNEELETSNEELKSSNEEMQSVNEELQSTNEELETSKEELQSLNEELATVNAELQNKVSDLSRANSDMNNLLAGTGIATVFVDHQLNIMRFTPTATRIINLILSDVGRPVGHIVSNLQGYDSLVEDTKEVLDTLIPKEVTVKTIDGKLYRMSIQPYRTLENVIEGAVLTFASI